MVAISMYSGNLHRVPDVPRRWPIPVHRFSLKDFGTLIDRRAKALSLLHSSSSNPNPNSPPPPLPTPLARQEVPDDVKPGSSSDARLGASEGANLVVDGADSEDKVKVEDEDEDGDMEPVDQVDLLVGDLTESEVKVCDQLELGGDESVVGLHVENGETTTVPAESAAAVSSQSPDDEGNNKLDTVNDTEKRKKEVEQKLQLLNGKKHKLVQALKQILNAEEELKRQSTAPATRPSLPLQVDVTTDILEVDDASNSNLQPRQSAQMSSASPPPSSDSALRKPPYFHHNPATNVSIGGTVATHSPSRLVHPGNGIFGQAANLPTMSVPGTNYVACSPSPEASGGANGFRDAGRLSPWR